MHHRTGKSVHRVRDGVNAADGGYRVRHAATQHDNSKMVDGWKIIFLDNKQRRQPRKSDLIYSYMIYEE